jgi:chlorobactene glucosyltransferase
MAPSIAWLILSTLGLLVGTALTWWLHRVRDLAIRVRPGAAAGGGGGPLTPALPAQRSAGLGAAGASVSVIVPARNEARNIERCVTALLAQTYDNFEVLVVDDRSTDETGPILARLAAGNPRLRLVPGEPLPPGWAGKPHALAQGVAAARGEWLCFVDADTFAGPSLLAATYATAQTYQADLFSILTGQKLATFWEKVVMPVVLSGLAFGFPPERVNDPQRPEAVANGQFILIRRTVYEAVGGHAALRASLVEDKDLAQAVKRAGYRLVLADGQDLAETRMYTSLPELWEGWTKNMFLGLQDRPWLLLLGAVASLAGALALPAWLLAGLVWALRGGGLPAVIVIVEAAAVWALVLYARGRVARRLGISAWYAFSLPLGAGVFAAMMATSTLRVLTGRGVVWKGRTYT